MKFIIILLFIALCSSQLVMISHYCDPSCKLLYSSRIEAFNNQCVDHEDGTSIVNECHSHWYTSTKCETQGCTSGCNISSISTNTCIKDIHRYTSIRCLDAIPIIDTPSYSRIQYSNTNCNDTLISNIESTDIYILNICSHIGGRYSKYTYRNSNVYLHICNDESCTSCGTSRIIDSIGCNTYGNTSIQVIINK